MARSNVAPLAPCNHHIIVTAARNDSAFRPCHQTARSTLGSVSFARWLRQLACCGAETSTEIPRNTSAHFGQRAARVVMVVASSIFQIAQ
eukprot:scaffold1193_cov158-Amphora_coffeaeformis.AAC.2